MPSPGGYLLIDRHIEKNAGSTYRELLWKAEANGLCLYWGYLQRSSAWSTFIDAMSNLNASSTPPRLCLEAHTGIDEKIPWLERLRQLRELRSTLAQHAVPLRVLLLLRLRDPLEHYLSFFLWAVVERQARAPAKFGSSFEEWMRRVPNLQSELLLSSKAAPTAGFAPRRHPEIRAWAERWGSPQAAAERRSLVWRTLEQFDVVGTTELFDETSLIVANTLSWSPADAASPMHPHEMPQPGASCSLMLQMERRQRRERSPWWCRDPSRSHAEEKERVQQVVCPNRTACEQIAREVAPVDYELYEYARRVVNAAVAAGGSAFRRQMRQLLRAKTQYKQPRCVWRALRPHVRASAALERHDRRRLRDATPNFSDNISCVHGEQTVMQTVWLEHGKGGRTKHGYPLSGLVSVERATRSSYINPAAWADRRAIPRGYRRITDYWDSAADAGRGV